MEYRSVVRLLAADGQPFQPRIERVLLQLLQRLRREFPSLQDEVTLAEVLEEAGRRICSREKRGGPLARLYGYAWVTIRSVATSRMRLNAVRLNQRTVSSEAASIVLSSAPSNRGTPDQIERSVLLRELLAKLSREERLICLWKTAGFSSQEIALHQQRTVVAVDTIFSRAKDKIRKALGMGDSAEGGEASRVSFRA